MTRFIVRPGRRADRDALLALARRAGKGFTNLPPDAEELERRLTASEQSLAQDIREPGGECYILMLEDLEHGRVVGTASLFSRLGVEWPWYSYRVTQVTQMSKELGKTLQSDVLYLVNEFDGWSEVGGLYVDPDVRRTGAGRLMARSRYLFLALNRQRFADHLLAELRGWQDADGRSPFWEGLGRYFFDMDFEEADRHNSLRGNQFIADLMPKYPIYVRTLPKAAQEAVNRPHHEGEAAVRLLAEEGFRVSRYVDIFDAGPTMTAAITDLKGVREARSGSLWVGAPRQGIDSLVASGTGAAFRCTRGMAEQHDDAVRLDDDSTGALALNTGDCLIHAPF